MLKLKNNLKGFTLTEIVSVVGLATLAVLLIYQIFIISQNAFKSGDQNLEIAQNGRIFLDRITREIRQTPEIATNLPATNNEEGFPPADEILFQNGHDTADIRYIRYFLDDQTVKRQEIAYFFTAEPETYVYWNSEDEFDDPPESSVLDEKIIAEYITDLDFYGSALTYIDVWLVKQDSDLHLFTGVWGRNTRN